MTVAKAEKIDWMGIGLNPKCPAKKSDNKRLVQNGQSAAKLVREGSTTIPKGSRGKRPEVVGPATEAGEDIVYASSKGEG